MNYEAQASAPTAKSLISDGVELVNRLSEVRIRISKLGDSLHGAEPRDVGLSKNAAPEPIPNVRRNLDAMLAMLIGIEQELTRVESRV